MILKNTLVLIVLFLPLGTLMTQAQSDSLKLIWEDESELDSIRFNALSEYHRINHNVNPDSTLESLEYRYKLAKEKNNTKQLYHSINNIGNINRLRGNYDLAMESYEEAKSLAEELNDQDLQAAILGNIGNVHIYQKDYKHATQNFSKALKIYQELEDIEDESRMLTNLGSVFLIINNYELASEYYQNALSILNKQGVVNRSTAILNINIGWTQFEQGLYKKAKINTEKALKIFVEENDKFFMAYCYSSLAKTCHKLTELSDALVYAKKELELNEELDIKNGIINAEITIAQITYDTNIAEATKKAEAILLKLPNDIEKESKSNLYELLYQCYKSQNKLDLSLQMHEKYSIYNDSIQQEKNNFEVAREAIKNDFELKLQESKIESELEKSELKNSQLKRTFGIITFAALLIASILFYFISKSKKDKHEREALLAEVERLKNLDSTIVAEAAHFDLERDKIETFIQRKLNETDWKVLNILLDDPVITNKDIAKKLFMSTDGIGSSLRRMYEYFEVKESKYKKISLLMMAIKLSNN